MRDPFYGRWEVRDSPTGGHKSSPPNSSDVTSIHMSQLTERTLFLRQFRFSLSQRWRRRQFCVFALACTHWCRRNWPPGWGRS
jgi:hypothetical protein